MEIFAMPTAAFKYSQVQEISYGFEMNRAGPGVISEILNISSVDVSKSIVVANTSIASWGNPQSWLYGIFRLKSSTEVEFNGDFMVKDDRDTENYDITVHATVYEIVNSFTKQEVVCESIYPLGIVEPISSYPIDPVDETKSFIYKQGFDGATGSLETRRGFIKASSDEVFYNDFDKTRPQFGGFTIVSLT